MLGSSHMSTCWDGTFTCLHADRDHIINQMLSWAETLGDSPGGGRGSSDLSPDSRRVWSSDSFKLSHSLCFQLDILFLMSTSVTFINQYVKCQKSLFCPSCLLPPCPPPPPGAQVNDLTCFHLLLISCFIIDSWTSFLENFFFFVYFRIVSLNFHFLTLSLLLF